ncbi:MAG TPA: class I SAM-dependent methyltransferase, partial [Gammaproteobacteria bacterium]|nr:class I SAM-dependent methyltransferase [Gammaproteobacteria bacterium]
MSMIDLAERRLLPDSLIRFGIRRLLRKRLADEKSADFAQQNEKLYQLLDTLRAGPVALNTDSANEQHYEVPTQFFMHALGTRLKYSCCYWPDGVHGLSAAEDAMLALTCERADLHDGQTVLELGCGWGSLSLWMAEHYPASQFTVVSNSRSQRETIESR